MLFFSATSTRPPPHRGRASSATTALQRGLPQHVRLPAHARQRHLRPAPHASILVVQASALADQSRRARVPLPHQRLPLAQRRQAPRLPVRQQHPCRQAHPHRRRPQQFRFNRWARRTSGTPTAGTSPWPTPTWSSPASSSPPPPPSKRTGPNHSPKFPGVAVKASQRTPEVYPRLVICPAPRAPPP